MKKLLIGLSVLFIISGCGDENKTLSCSSTSETNGVTTKTTYSVKYKDDEVNHVIITYDYTQENNRNETDSNENNSENNNQDNTDTDGVNADTDGTTENNNTNKNDNTLESNEVVDGAVGDAIDNTIDGVKDTILDLAGIKSSFQNQMNIYDDIEGLTYKVDIDNDNEYKVIYEIDMNKISDEDLKRFDVVKDFSEMKTNYENQGYTCK